LQLMEERPAVEEWRSTLPDYERRSLNNPVIVWRKWTAATRVKKPKSRTAAVSATEHGRAQAIIEQLQARIGELEEEAHATKVETPWKGKSVHEIADELVAALSRDKFESLSRRLVKMIERKAT